jgi:hypothetical protein
MAARGDECNDRAFFDGDSEPLETSATLDTETRRRPSRKISDHIGYLLGTLLPFLDVELKNDVGRV